MSKKTMSEVLRKHMQKMDQGQTYEAALLEGLNTGRFDESALTSRERKKLDEERSHK